MVEFLIPATRFSSETQVINSRFIATISPAFSVEKAKLFIKEIRHQYADASHNVPVFLIGFGSSVITHSSDDGEPSGTAGRPALSVLNGSGLGDTVMVITRYFGGTKLGTGGLVKAYGDSARGVIQAVPKAIKVEVHYGSLICPYNLYEQVKMLLSNHQGEIQEDNFSDVIELHFAVPIDQYDLVTAKIIEVSSGQIKPDQLKTHQFMIKPYSEKS